MKKLWIAFAIAMAALMVFAGPAFASEGNANADVDCSDIDVTDDEPAVGSTITFSGNVTIDCSANYSQSWESGGWWYDTYAESQAWYRVYNPDGVLIVDYHFPVVKDSDPGTLSDYPELLFEASAAANQSVDWSVDVYIELVGDYLAEHGGEAYAEYGHMGWVWVEDGGGGGCDGDWEYKHIFDDSAYDSCRAERTVTSHSSVVSSASYSRPYLVIALPDGSRHFFSKDGWGDPTTQDIVYTDGIWQVEIQDGTAIQLDGEWHKTTYLDVDDQGNVTGRYDAGGSTIAEDIGLSQPITITKVG